MKVSLNPRLSAYNRGLINNVQQTYVNYELLSDSTKINPMLRTKDVISFGNSGSSVIFVGAELEGVIKQGGVANVMGDYEKFGPVVIPYYNGDIQYDTQTGNPTGEVKVWTNTNGKPIFTNENLNEKSIQEVLEQKKYFELEEIAKDTIPWGKEEKSPITLYKVVNNEKHKNLYIIYTDATAKLQKPYEDLCYYSSEAGKQVETSKAWEGTPHGKFGKAFTQFLDKFGLSKEATVICSDSQTANIPFLMSEMSLNNDPKVAGKSVTYIGHNLGEGYQGTTTARKMLINLGLNKQQIELIESDSNYLDALKRGMDEEYLSKLIPDILDANNQPNPIKLIIELRKQGYVAAFDTVSEEYANAVANNPRMAKAIQKEYLELLQQGKVGGILNAQNDERLAYYNPVTLPGYAKPVEIKDVSGNVVETIEPFKTFPKDVTLEEAKKIKLENRKNLFKRLSGKYADNMVITGLSNKKAELIGTIDPKWIEEIEKGNQVDLYVSWGRGDLQKGLDTAIDAFEIFARKPEGQNAVLVLGGELPEEGAEADRILSKLKILLADERYKGRISFIKGFAPGIPLSSAGDMALLPSRFAPCELTDFEAMKYLCTPNVANTQGLRQKNFDPRDKVNAELATSFRTKTEFFCPIDEALEADSKLKQLYDTMLAQEKTKLTLRKVDAEKIEELAKQNVLESNKFSAALRDSVDARIAQELADNMVEFKHLSKETAEKMLHNQKNINTKWSENALFHPSKKSTGELYEARHFNAKSVKPQKSLFNFESLFAQIKGKAQTAAQEGTQVNSKINVETTVKIEKLEELINQLKKTTESALSIKKHYAIAAGAVALSFAAGAFIVHKTQQQKNNSQPQINSHGDSFNQTKTKQNNHPNIKKPYVSKFR